MILKLEYPARTHPWCDRDGWQDPRYKEIKCGGTKAQFMAMLVDFFPEAISLDRRLGFLLAAFIGTLNLPDEFNSYREKVSAGSKPIRVLLTLLVVNLLGPVAAVAGFIPLQVMRQSPPVS